MSLESLRVYAHSKDLSDRIAAEARNWHVFDQRTLGSQIVRAADSVSNNIAEGYGRASLGERLQFYMYAVGSVLETRNCLDQALSRRLIDATQAKELVRLCYQIYRSIIKLAYVQLNRDPTYKGHYREIITERHLRLSKGSKGTL